MSRSTRVFILCCLCVLGLSACVSFGRVVAHDALEFNKAYERQTNEEILLNILRASKLRPMKFTALTQLNGSLSVQAGSSFGIPFGANAITDEYSAEPSLEVRKNPQFTMVPGNRSKKFTTGIMSPIDASLLQHFISQGWPGASLLTLFGEGIEFKIPRKMTSSLCTDSDKQTGRCRCEKSKGANADTCYRFYKNNPNASELEDVAPKARDRDICQDNTNLDLEAELCGFVNAVNKVGAAVKFTSSEEAIGPQFTLSGDTVVEQVVKAVESRLSIKCIKNGELGDCKDGAGRLQLYRSASELVLPLGRDMLPSEMASELKRFSENDQTKMLKETQARVGLRSTEGVLFYLGEIVDAQSRHEMTVCVNDKGRIAIKHVDACVSLENGKPRKGQFHLFRLRRAMPIFEPAYFSVSYEGARYIVPDYEKEPSNSSVILGIVDLLIGLKMEAETLAGPQNVRIIGGGS